MQREMKKFIRIIYTGEEKNGFLIELSVGITGEEFTKLKKDYFFFLDEAIKEVKKSKTAKTIYIDELPKLSGSFKELVKYMTGIENVVQYNERREQAKSFFTFDCICKLDASGQINKLIYNEQARVEL